METMEIVLSLRAHGVINSGLHIDRVFMGQSLLQVVFMDKLISFLKQSWEAVSSPPHLTSEKTGPPIQCTELCCWCQSVVANKVGRSAQPGHHLTQDLVGFLRS